MSFTEGSYENALITLYKNMGYQHLYGPDIERDYYVPFYEEQVLSKQATNCHPRGYCQAERHRYRKPDSKERAFHGLSSAWHRSFLL